MDIRTVRISWPALFVTSFVVGTVIVVGLALPALLKDYIFFLGSPEGATIFLGLWHLVFIAILSMLVFRCEAVLEAFDRQKYGVRLTFKKFKVNLQVVLSLSVSTYLAYYIAGVPILSSLSQEQMEFTMVILQLFRDRPMVSFVLPLVGIVFSYGLNEYLEQTATTVTHSKEM